MASERRKSISLPFCPSFFSQKDESPRLRRKLQKAKHRQDFDPDIIGGPPSMLSLGGGTHVGKSAVSTQNPPPLPPIPQTSGDGFLSIKYDPKLGLSMINVLAPPDSPTSTASHGHSHSNSQSSSSSHGSHGSHSNHSASTFRTATSGMMPPSPTSSSGSPTSPVSPISPIIQASAYGTVGTIARSSNGHDIKAQVAAAAKLRAQEKAEKKAQAQNQVRALALIDAQEREAATQAWAAAHRTDDGLRSPLSAAGRPVVPPLTVPGTVQRHFPQFHRPYQMPTHQSAQVMSRESTAADHIQWHNRNSSDSSNSRDSSNDNSNTRRNNRSNSHFPPIVRHHNTHVPTAATGSQASLVPSSPGGTMSISSTYASSFTHSFNGSTGAVASGGAHGMAAVAPMGSSSGSAPLTPLSPPHAGSTSSFAPSHHSSSSDPFYAHAQLAKSSPRIVPELSHLVRDSRDNRDNRDNRAPRWFSHTHTQSEQIGSYTPTRTRSKSCAPAPDSTESLDTDASAASSSGEKRRKPKTPVYSIGQLESTGALHDAHDADHANADQSHADQTTAVADPASAELNLLNSKSSIECIADEYRALLASRNSAFTDALSDFGDDRPSTVVHDPVRFQTPLSYPPQQPPVEEYVPVPQRMQEYAQQQQQQQQQQKQPIQEYAPTQQPAQNMRPLPLRNLQQQQQQQQQEQQQQPQPATAQKTQTSQPQKLHKQPRKFMLFSSKPKADSISSASPLPSPAFPSHAGSTNHAARAVATDKQQPTYTQAQPRQQQQPQQQFHGRNESRDTFGYAREAPLPAAPVSSSKSKFEFEFDDDDNQHVQEYHLQQQQQQQQQHAQQMHAQKMHAQHAREQPSLREQYSTSLPKLGHARNRSYVSSSSGSSSAGGSASGSSINYSLPGAQHRAKYAASSISSASTTSSSPPPPSSSSSDNNVSLQICMDLLSRELTSAVTPAPGSKSTAERAAERKVRDFWGSGDDEYCSKMPGSWLDSSKNVGDSTMPDMPAPPPVTSATSALQVLVMIEAYEQLRDRMVADARRAKRKDAGQVEQMFGLWLRTLYNMHDNLTATGSETEAEAASGVISESEYDSSMSIRS